MTTFTPRPFRKRTRFLSGISAFAALAATLFVGGGASAQAEQQTATSAVDITAVGNYYNGYYIENNTGQKLILDSKKLPGEEDWGSGTRPPEVIYPDHRGYFEIQVHRDSKAKDGGEIVYTTLQGQKVYFFADVTVRFTRGKWFEPIFDFRNDFSKCHTGSYANNGCSTKESTGRGDGKQTIFTVNSFPS